MANAMVAHGAPHAVVVDLDASRKRCRATREPEARVGEKDRLKWRKWRGRRRRRRQIVRAGAEAVAPGAVAIEIGLEVFARQTVVDTGL